MVRPLRLAVTFETVPVIPLTLITDGYGLPLALPLGLLLIVMADEFVNVTPPGVGVGVGVGGGPMSGKSRVISSTGRPNVFDWPALSVEIWVLTPAISVRVKALTVTLWFSVNPAAAVAAAVFATNRQITVALGTRSGRNRKYWLTASASKAERAVPAYWT